MNEIEYDKNLLELPISRVNSLTLGLSADMHSTHT